MVFQSISMILEMVNLFLWYVLDFQVEQELQFLWNRLINLSYDA